ncbi:MAG: hypothetical protein ACKO2V_16340, partial [Snowella sp.]
EQTEFLLGAQKWAKLTSICMIQSERRLRRFLYLCGTANSLPDKLSSLKNVPNQAFIRRNVDIALIFHAGFGQWDKMGCMKNSNSVPPRWKVPKRVLYVILLLIFSSSTVGILADLETLYLFKLYLLLFLLQGGFFLIYFSFYRLPRRRLLLVKRNFLTTKGDQDKFPTNRLRQIETNSQTPRVFIEQRGWSRGDGKSL